MPDSLYNSLPIVYTRPATYPNNRMETFFNASYCVALNTPNSPPYLVTLLLPYTCLIWFFYDALIILVFLAMYFLFAFTGD